MFTEIAELKRENRMLSDMVYRLAEKIVGLAEKGVEGYTGA